MRLLSKALEAYADFQQCWIDVCDDAKIDPTEESLDACAEFERVFRKMVGADSQWLESSDR
jgi:hypothetical protein